MNHIIICGFITMVVAQVLKVPFAYFKNHTWNVNLLFSTGALPSSHTAVVTATMLIVGVINGFDSTSFGIAFIFGLIVIHDAIKVRGEGNKQAKAINIIIKDLIKLPNLDQQDREVLEKIELNELIGHTVTEVMIGIIVGLITGMLYALLILN